MTFKTISSLEDARLNTSHRENSTKILSHEISITGEEIKATLWRLRWFEMIIMDSSMQQKKSFLHPEN